MPKEKLISVRDASLKTGIAEETIIKQLKSGSIRGEKKNYFLWDDWFVSLKEVAKLQNIGSTNDNRAAKSVTAEKQESGQSSVVSSGATATLVAGETTGTPSTSENSTAEIAQGLAEEIDRAFVPNTFAQAFASRGKSEEYTPPSASVLDELTSATGSEVAVLQNDTVDEEPNQAGSPEAWTEYRQRAKTVAEEFLAPLLARLEMQANLLHEKDVIIAEQSAQLRLLPDFQRQTEESQLLAQAKEKEAFELRQNLMWERKKALIKLSAWQMKHLRVQKQMKEASDELAVVQEEKDVEVNYLHGQLTELQSQLTEMQKPWWKKISARFLQDG